MNIKDSINQRFIAAESDSLVIETIQTDSKTRRQKLRILRLKGTWRANDYNELVFEAVLHKGPPQAYTFKGAWKINKNQEIEYTFSDGTDTLVFKGYWQLPSANRLVYVLEGSRQSRFEFKVQLESPSLYPKSGEIRYRIGIGLRQNQRNRLIVLYGEWKLGRTLGLVFSMDYGKAKVREIEFGVQATWQRSKLILSLKSTAGKPLGMTLTYTRKFLNKLEPELLLRLKSYQK